jgi:hypothetical protein
MPKFFDSHQEFNEWFSRGIENTVTGGGGSGGGGENNKFGGISERMSINRSTCQPCGTVWFAH